MSTNFEDVRAFHEKFRLIVNDRPRQLTDARLRKRIEFLWEEFREFFQSCGFELYTEPDKDYMSNGICSQRVDYLNKSIQEQAEALIDIVYIAMGTAVMMGLPWQELWDDVHKRNMAKVKAENPTDHHNVIKPDGWSPPITGEILLKAGYDTHDEEVG